MEKVCIKKGDYNGLIGDAVFLPGVNKCSVSIPSFEDPQIKEIFDLENLQFSDARRPSPILAIKENTNLHYKDEVQLIAHKKSCGSVWCKSCFKYKGGAKRISDKLKEFNYKKTRQIILTVDPKKFDDGQNAYEYLKEKGATHQFIHNLKRTSKVKITNWTWILEWHKNGLPHWHLFVEVDKEGKAGMIGNKTLLQHWSKYGIVREKPVLSQKHWNQFTDYFGVHGYFGFEKKDKSHQLELPEWAKKATYRIRKTGSMKKSYSSESENEFVEDKEEFETEKKHTRKKNQTSREITYTNLLNSCGQQILALVRRGDSLQIWRKYDIPYRLLVEQYAGDYIEEVGYVFQMSRTGFFLFEALYDIKDTPDQTLKEG